ncbi:MAG: hypothetical protein ACO36C_05060 [Methylophilaceae bacterium]
MKFVKLLLLAVVIYYLIYYFFSPYQQCIREFNGSGVSMDEIEGTPDKIQTQRRQLLNIAKDGHKQDCAQRHHW